MEVLNDKDVRQKTGVILEQKSNLMGEETGMDKKWTLHVENFAKIKSAVSVLRCSFNQLSHCLYAFASEGFFGKISLPKVNIPHKILIK